MPSSRVGTPNVIQAPEQQQGPLHGQGSGEGIEDSDTPLLALSPAQSKSPMPSGLALEGNTGSRPPSRQLTEQQSAREECLTLRVKTLDSKEHSVEMEPSVNIGQMKGKIAKALHAEGKFLRLIAGGKMLQPDSASLSSFRIADKAFVHCVISEHQPLLGPHIGIDLDPVEYPEVDDDPALRRGFDRLRTEGFTSHEVAAIRSSFTPAVQTYAVRQEVREGESAEERTMRMEEEWIDRQGETSEYALNTNRLMSNRTTFGSRADGDRSSMVHVGSGTSRDFLYGFCLGAVLGIISLFWLYSLPCTYQQKMGIIAGVSVQLAWNIVRQQTNGSL